MISGILKKNLSQTLTKKSKKRFFRMMPDIVDVIDLSGLATKIYLHLLRISNFEGKSFKGSKYFMDLYGISKKTWLKAKDELSKEREILAGKPLISFTERYVRNFRLEDCAEIVDIWEENEAYFDKTIQDLSSAKNVSFDDLAEKSEQENHDKELVEKQVKKSRKLEGGGVVAEITPPGSPKYTPQGEGVENGPRGGGISTTPYIRIRDSYKKDIYLNKEGEGGEEEEESDSKFETDARLLHEYHWPKIRDQIPDTHSVDIQKRVRDFIFLMKESDENPKPMEKHEIMGMIDFCLKDDYWQAAAGYTTTFVKHHEQLRIKMAQLRQNCSNPVPEYKPITDEYTKKNISRGYEACNALKKRYESDDEMLMNYSITWTYGPHKLEAALVVKMKEKTYLIYLDSPTFFDELKEAFCKMPK